MQLQRVELRSILKGKVFESFKEKRVLLRLSRYEEDGVQDQAVAREVLLLRGMQEPDRD